MMADKPLQSFEIQLRNLDGPLPIQAVRAGALNGMFYSEMKLRNPNWFKKHHRPNANMPQPFSLSLLFDEGMCLGFRAGL